MRRIGKRRVSKFAPFLIIGLIILILITGILVARSSFFNIKEISINLEKVNCTDSESIKISSGLLGQNLFFLDSMKVVDSIKSQFICIRDIDLSKQFPSKVNLSAFGREPFGKLMVLSTQATPSALENIATPSAQNNEGFLVDKDGVVYSLDLEQNNIPNIFISKKEISLGTKLEEDVTNALKILERVKIFNLNLQTVQILDNFLIIFPNFNTPKVIFRLEKEIDTQIASLQLILEKAKIDDRILEFIDLRFDKPIVRFAPKKK